MGFLAEGEPRTRLGFMCWLNFVFVHNGHNKLVLLYFMQMGQGQQVMADKLVMGCVLLFHVSRQTRLCLLAELCSLKDWL